MTMVVSDDASHKQALKKIDHLMAQIDKLNGELEAIADVVEKYEEGKFKLNKPTALDVIKFHMEQNNYTQSDLAKVLGSRSRASEILNGKKECLSFSQIRKLHDIWGISAESLILPLVRSDSSGIK